jgi:hypothetical protein
MNINPIGRVHDSDLSGWAYPSVIQGADWGPLNSCELSQRDSKLASDVLGKRAGF